MSPAMTALSSIGVTHNVLILCVLAAVAAGVIGLFWHYIVPGAIIIGVAALFYVAPEVTTKTEPQTEKTEVVVDKKDVEVIDEYQAYMKDCMDVAEYPMYQCKKLWNERNGKSAEADVDFKPASDVKLLETDNDEYKARREAVIQKPGAVVMQATYH